jgi:hypothetical protein
MEAVALRLPEEHFLGEQTFPPKCNQSDAIEQRWVQGPKSHEFANRALGAESITIWDSSWQAGLP